MILGFQLSIDDWKMLNQESEIAERQA